MPRKAIVKKEDNDKFYTNPVVAEELFNEMHLVLDKFNINTDYLIEPSAGSGSFSKLFKETDLAFDLVPEEVYDGIDIVQKDWFTFNSTDLKDGTFGIVGNPPFGNRNDLSKAFIKHGMQFRDCKFIAMVLPAVYQKITTQTIFSTSWKLIHDAKLPNDSFLLDGEPYHVPCVFQIWVNDVDDEIDCNLRQVQISLDNDIIEFTNVGSTHFLFGAAPKNIIDIQNVLPNNRGYKFKCLKNVDEVQQIFNSIDWKSEGKSSVNGGVSWFTKQEIVKLLRNI